MSLRKVLKLLQSGCDMCHQSDSTTCHSPTPNSYKQKHSQRISTHLERHPHFKQHQRRFRSIEISLESSPKAFKNFKNFNLKYKKHLKQNHSNHLPRSQISLESSSKLPETSRNHKSVKLYEFKPLKPQRISNTNL